MNTSLDSTLSTRQTRFALALARLEADYTYITDGPTLRWLFGANGQPRLFPEKPGALDESGRLVDLTGVAALAIVGTLNAQHVSKLLETPGLRVVDGARTARLARRSKDDVEKVLLREAAERSARAVEQSVGQLNNSEYAFAAHLRLSLALQGLTDWAYDPSVASGTRTSLIWAQPRSNVRMADTSHSVIDAAGALVHYKADMTFVVNRAPGPHLAGIRALVEIDSCLEHALMSGERNCAMLARRADNELQARGLPQLPHALGHGVGLELHEYPFISRDSKDTLEPGDFFMIEPAFYIPETYGARFESLYTIEDDGTCVRVTNAVDLSRSLSAPFD